MKQGGDHMHPSPSSHTSLGLLRVITATSAFLLQGDEVAMYLMKRLCCKVALYVQETTVLVTVIRYID